jgi:hypothetical protein
MLGCTVQGASHTSHGSRHMLWIDDMGHFDEAGSFWDMAPFVPCEMPPAPLLQQSTLNLKLDAAMPWLECLAPGGLAWYPLRLESRDWAASFVESR